MVVDLGMKDDVWGGGGVPGKQKSCARTPMLVDRECHEPVEAGFE